MHHTFAALVLAAGLLGSGAAPAPEPEPESSTASEPDPDPDPNPDPDPDPDPDSTAETGTDEAETPSAPQGEERDPPDVDGHEPSTADPDPSRAATHAGPPTPTSVDIPHARLDSAAPPRVLTSLGIAGAVTTGYGVASAGAGLGLMLQTGNPDLNPVGTAVLIGGGALTGIGLGMLIGDLVRYRLARRGKTKSKREDMTQLHLGPMLTRPGATIGARF